MNWLLLRGLGREQRHWSRFPGQLREQLGDRVLCLDLPGAGTECKRPAPDSIAANVEDLRRRWLPAARDSGPWGIIGLSLGGMLALDWLHRYGDDFALGVLINSSAGKLSGPINRLRPGVAGIVLRIIFAKSRLARERLTLLLTSDVHGDDYQLAEEWAGFAKDSPVRTTAFLRQLYAALRFRPPVELHTPLLVLGSAKDRMVHPACSRAIARHYNAKIACHPSAGHDLPLDDPEWVCKRIAEFVRPNADTF